MAMSTTPTREPSLDLKLAPNSNVLRWEREYNSTFPGAATISHEPITRIGPWAIRRAYSEGSDVLRGGINAIGEKDPSSPEAMAKIHEEFESLRQLPRSDKSLEGQEEVH